MAITFWFCMYKNSCQEPTIYQVHLYMNSAQRLVRNPFIHRNGKSHVSWWKWGSQCDSDLVILYHLTCFQTTESTSRKPSPHLTFCIWLSMRIRLRYQESKSKYEFWSWLCCLLTWAKLLMFDSYFCILVEISPLLRGQMAHSSKRKAGRTARIRKAMGKAYWIAPWHTFKTHMHTEHSHCTHHL